MNDELATRATTALHPMRKTRDAALYKQLPSRMRIGSYPSNGLPEEVYEISEEAAKQLHTIVYTR